MSKLPDLRSNRRRIRLGESTFDLYKELITIRKNQINLSIHTRFSTSFSSTHSTRSRLLELFLLKFVENLINIFVLVIKLLIK